MLLIAASRSPKITSLSVVAASNRIHFGAR